MIVGITEVRQFGYKKIGGIFLKDRKIFEILRDLNSMFPQSKVTPFGVLKDWNDFSELPDIEAGGFKSLIKWSCSNIAELESKQIDRSCKKKFSYNWDLIMSKFALACNLQEYERDLLSSVGLRLYYILAAFELRHSTAMDILKVSPSHLLFFGIEDIGSCTEGTLYNGNESIKLCCKLYNSIFRWFLATQIEAKVQDTLNYLVLTDDATFEADYSLCQGFSATIEAPDTDTTDVSLFKSVNSSQVEPEDIDEIYNTLMPEVIEDTSSTATDNLSEQSFDTDTNINSVDYALEEIKQTQEPINDNECVTIASFTEQEFKPKITKIDTIHAFKAHSSYKDSTQNIDKEMLAYFLGDNN